MVVVIVEDTEGIGDGVHHGLGNLLPGLVAAQHSAPVGSEVEIDEGLDSQVSVIVGPGLQGEQRVDVDRADPQPLLGGVVRVAQGSSPVNLARVQWVAGVARLGLGQAEGYSDVWLQLSCRGGGADQVGQVPEYSLI